MRVQGINTAISGPVGALPVPAPLREDRPFFDRVANANRPQPSDPMTPHAPLTLSSAHPETPEGPPPIPRLDAARAYARAPKPATPQPPHPMLSLKA